MRETAKERVNLPKRLSMGLILLLASFAGNSVGQVHTVSVDVPLVLIDVVVFDAKGRAVSNLSKESFSIFEDGALQEIKTFEPMDTPFSTLLLFDCSDSTRDQWSLFQAATEHFSKWQRPQDRSAVALFGSGVKLLSNWGESNTSSLDVQNRPGICKGSLTDLYGSVECALDKLRDVEGRKGLVLFTDGVHGGMPRRTMVMNDQVVNVPVNSAEDKAFQEVLRIVLQ